MGIIRYPADSLGWIWVHVACILLWVTSLSQGAEVPSFTEFHFTAEPSDTIAYKGSSFHLDCSVFHSNGYLPLIKWFKDDSLVNLTQDRRYTVASNGSLLVSSATDKKSGTDEGEYACSGTIEGETILSRKAHVTIAGIVRNFDINPHDLEVYLTDTAMFQCHIDSVPAANITWYKDDEPVQDRSGKYRTYPEGVLEIYNVAFRDFGTYHCVAEGVDKSRRSPTAKLLQKKAVVEQDFQGITPNFTVKPRDSEVVVGANRVILFCGAYGLGSDMKQPSITWLKDGKTIDLERDGRVTMIGGGNLQILNVRTATPIDPETDDATYMCRAENDVDSADAEAKLTVIVPPTFSKIPQNVLAHAKDDITLECEATGLPKPKVTWYKDGRLITEGDYFEFVDDSNLRILGLIASDTGFYQCFAENTGGNIQKTIQLMVRPEGNSLTTNPSTPSIYYHLHRSGALTGTNRNEVPSQPTGLQAVIVSTRFVTLSWGAPERIGMSEIIAYVISWQEKGSERERMTNTTTREVNIQRLKPNTEYEFRVSAHNKYGSSFTPALLEIRTQEEDDVPSEAQDVEAVALSPTSILLSWKPPAQPKGRITHYQLFYYESGLSREEKKETKETSYMFNNLQEYVEYNFRIVAHNANGDGLSTTEVSCRTFSDVPSDFPQNFTLETTSSTSIVVRWQPPKPEHQNGKITGYKIRYKKKGVKKGSTVTTAGDRDGYALTELKKGTTYQVRISAQTVNGSGPPTDWEFATTYEDDLDETQVPDIPDRLVVEPTTNSLVVQWYPNRRSKYLVRGYYLGYGKGIPDVFRQLFDANHFFYTIKDLQSASEYVVSIRAFNDKGEGQPRYETVFTKEVTAEEPVTPMLPPIGLKAIVLSANTIVLTWTDNSLGKIQRITDNRYYTIMYNTVPARGKAKFVNSTDLVRHIEDLKPDTRYEFSVKVTKGRRKSQYSMTVSNKTQESAPGSMPRDLTPVPVEGNPFSVTLNWQPPQKPNGQITGYLVFYTTDPNKDDLEWVVEGVIGESLSMTITDLTEDTQYYFKVQARNSKGYGPMSSTVIYRTPSKGILNGMDYPNINNPDTSDGPETQGGTSEEKGLSQNLMIIIIAILVGTTFCIVVAIVTVILCRNRNMAARNRRMANMYKQSPQKGLGPKPLGPPKGEGQPPDLWLHDHLELKHMGKDERAESSLSVSSTRRNSHDSSSIHTNNPAEIYQSGSEAEERLLPPSYHQLNTPQQRNIIRPKPLKIPVESQIHQKEPVATVAAYPNGHLMQKYTSPPNCPPSPTEDSGVIPMRPVYPRTQYQMQYAAQGPPRVNAGDISNTSMHGGFPMEYGYRLVPCIEEDDHCHPDAYDDSYMNRVGYVKPQQSAPPYKKASAPISSGPIKPRSMIPAPMVSPKSAPDVLKTGKEEAEIQKSLSTEELTAEMANLEGLMKDLNAITQQDFEC